MVKEAGAWLMTTKTSGTQSNHNRRMFRPGEVNTLLTFKKKGLVHLAMVPDVQGEGDTLIFHIFKMLSDHGVFLE